MLYHEYYAYDLYKTDYIIPIKDKPPRPHKIIGKPHKPIIPKKKHIYFHCRSMLR